MSESKNPEVIGDIQETLDEVFDAFSMDYVKRMDDLARERRLTRLLATDTSLEYVSPNAWRSSEYHKRILEGSYRLARKIDLRFYRYIRLLLFRNPLRFLADTNWLRSLKYLIDFHRQHQIGLGVCRRALLPEITPDHLLNFYLIPGQVVTLWNPHFASAYDFPAEAKVEIVQEYEQLFETLENACTTEDGGFWITKLMSLNEVKAEITELFKNKYDS